MTLAVLAGNSKALWYLTRGTGLVALLLLTASMVLGLTEAVRFTRPRLPRFVVAALHQNVSLLAVAFLAVHIATSVLDSYAPIRVVDVFVPFVSSYRPFWLGLGALSLDVLLAVVVTSLVRERVGYRAWRLVHWGAYVSWPIAVVHGLGTGSDTKLGWVLALNGLCGAAVLGAIWWRLACGWSVADASRRAVAVFASLALPVGIAVWTVSGPLRPGWARKAGTPVALLGSSQPATSSPAPSTATLLAVPFTASFTGSQTQSGPGSEGLVTVTIIGTLSGGAAGQLKIVLSGTSTSGGGVQLTGSQVTLGPASEPAQYQGRVTRLQGSTVVAALTGPGDQSVTLTAALQLSQATNAVTGTAKAA